MFVKGIVLISSLSIIGCRENNIYLKQMPLRWYGNGDLSDPTYLHFSRIVNFTIHFMAFAAVNSGLWFIQQINHPWSNLKPFTLIWLVLIILNLLFVILKRPSSSNDLLEE